METQEKKAKDKFSRFVIFVEKAVDEYDSECPKDNFFVEFELSHENYVIRTKSRSIKKALKKTLKIYSDSLGKFSAIEKITITKRK